MDEVWANGLQVNEHIVELLQDEEAAGHALTSWNRIALRWRSTDHLEEVLSDAHVIFLITRLADDCMHNGLENVLLGKHTLHILDKLVGLIDLIILQVVNDQVETSLRDDINQRRKNL